MRPIKRPIPALEAKSLSDICNRVRFVNGDKLTDSLILFWDNLRSTSVVRWARWRTPSHVISFSERSSRVRLRSPAICNTSSELIKLRLKSNYLRRVSTASPSAVERLLSDRFSHVRFTNPDKSHNPIDAMPFWNRSSMTNLESLAICHNPSECILHDISRLYKLGRLPKRRNTSEVIWRPTMGMHSRLGNVLKTAKFSSVHGVHTLDTFHPMEACTRLQVWDTLRIEGQ